MPPPDPLEWSRPKDGLDRRGLRHVVIGLSGFFAALFLLFAADIVGVERRLTTATVVEKIDVPEKHGGHECQTVLATGYGYAKLFTPRFCRFTPWHIGDSAVVQARELRFTHVIVVSTRKTIFEGANSVLPES